MRLVWCASIVNVQLFGLHHPKDDFWQDGFKQGKFVRGDSVRRLVESNLGLDGFVHSFWHLLSCKSIPAHAAGTAPLLPVV